MFSLNLNQTYLLATIRMFVVGEVVRESLGGVHLRKAVRIREMAGFDETLRTGKITQWEKIENRNGEWIVPSSSLQGIGEWVHPLPGW